MLATCDNNSDIRLLNFSKYMTSSGVAQCPQCMVTDGISSGGLIVGGGGGSAFPLGDF